MFVHPDDRDMVLSERQRLISHGAPYELEARLLGKDGQYRWFLIRVSPSRDEQETHHPVVWDTDGDRRP